MSLVVKIAFVILMCATLIWFFKKLHQKNVINDQCMTVNDKVEGKTIPEGALAKYAINDTKLIASVFLLFLLGLAGLFI